ncbi:DUF1707 SHOCT-like domain-containing protein [Actinoplanes sp. CA-030573]|uniref:DUF1707 SHOCT-like domain-containing protein n=1 Tax=Actinoplanes sp. CA-030573 TaxID=3239898 RepID=UPI003D8ABBF3
MRCSDADREGIAGRLRAAAAEGRLGMDEFEERTAAVYAARYDRELSALVADLPPAPGSAGNGWRAVLLAMWRQILADLSLLIGRRGAGSSRRRLVIAALVILFLAGVVLAAVLGVDGGGHHGFEHQRIGRGF